MRLSKLCLGALFVGCVVTEGACGGSFFGPSPTGGPFQISGEVLDDSEFLPPESKARITLEGARVEILDGTDKGRTTISDSLGRFDLGSVILTGPSGATTPVRLRASKDGWLAKEWQILGTFSTKPVFHLSQPPHVVWGCFSLGISGGQLVPHVGVRVQIVDGPAAGRVAFSDNNGYFRFDGLATQPQLSVEASTAGYRSTRFRTDYALEGNESVTGGCNVLQPE